MCGRVFFRTTVEALMRSFAWAEPSPEFQGEGPRHNGAPGLSYPIVTRVADRGTAAFVSARWGFIPRWSKEPKPRHTQYIARADKLAISNLYKDAYAFSRGLMPVDGFFEWRAVLGEKAKQPYAIAMKDGRPFTIGVIWALRRLPGGVEERTFAIITTEANALLREIHDRMPVIIAPEDRERWLSEAEADPAGLLQPFPSDLMTLWKIDRRVGNVRNADADLLAPIA